MPTFAEMMAAQAAKGHARAAALRTAQGLPPEPEPAPQDKGGVAVPRAGKMKQPPKDPPKTAREETGVKTQETVWRRKPAARSYINAVGVGKCCEQFQRLPGPGESIHVLMGGDYHGFDIIPMLTELGGTIETLHIATLSFSKGNTLALCELIDSGRVKACHLLASHMFSQKDPEIYGGCCAELRSRGQTIGMTRNHAKIVAAHIVEGPAPGFYVFEGSANLRSCLSLEQLCLSNDEGLYGFHVAWISHCLTNPETAGQQASPGSGADMDDTGEGDT